MTTASISSVLALVGSPHIVEIKRGAHVASVKDINQADKYRKYVLKRFGELSDPKAIKYAYVQSHLIAAELHQDAQSIKESFANSGWAFFTTWDDLIERAKQSHNQFREILQERAGASDEALDPEAVAGSADGPIDTQPTKKPGTNTKRKKKGRKK